MTLYGGVIGSPLNTDNTLTARQNLGVEIRGDFAWKEGPTLYVSAYKNRWNQAGQQGTSLNATANSDYITVNETGYYYLHGWQRGSVNEFMALALNGDRGSLEGRSDNLWSHDHTNGGGNWSHGKMIGYLEAGWNITFGPATAGWGTFSVQGHDGGLLIRRLR